jgi:hypothetical protein
MMIARLPSIAKVLIWFEYGVDATVQRLLTKAFHWTATGLGQHFGRARSAKKLDKADGTVALTPSN